jgi:hypothetical protein
MRTKGDNMNYKIGQKVELNGETYTIAGTIKRSWLLEKDGKQYKATSAMLNKIKDHNETYGIRKKRHRRKVDHMTNRLRYRQIFDKSTKMPETENECLDWLEMICNDLSPENLHCDGEISRTAAMKKYRALKAEWKEVEKILGYKISEVDVESRMIKKWRKNRK